MDKSNNFAYKYPAASTSQGVAGSFDITKMEEQWQKIQEAGERRKVQNLLAQRKYRKNLKRRIEDFERQNLFQNQYWLQLLSMVVCQWATTFQGEILAWYVASNAKRAGICTSTMVLIIKASARANLMDCIAKALIGRSIQTPEALNQSPSRHLPRQYNTANVYYLEQLCE
ncbi:hypothetical protein BP5796_09239 [Coleophoma crateriformis]|uniref:BZIP domain-containing protein n=1 Tax=Coleophoma crateriformis TaxID=565419 RepID=A0A3D8R3F9_9HELO|nr:hypothetical protein BP5796_09239 [Coleophoma crateriformis]